MPSISMVASWLPLFWMLLLVPPKILILLAALPGYISNYVPRARARFSADFGGYPGVALRRLGSTVRFEDQSVRAERTAPPG